jgi:hypothetical protein
MNEKPVSASEAVELTEKGVRDAYRWEMRYVWRRIRETCGVGDRSVLFGQRGIAEIDDAVVKKLKEHGYTIKVEKDIYWVSW